MTTPLPDHIADLFDLPPEAPPSAEAIAAAAAAAEAAEAAEAALAAEIAATIESGEFAGDAPDSRSNHRVEVSWPARMQLADGRVVALEVRNVSEGGAGLVSNEPIPADTVVGLEIEVPALDADGEIVLVKGRIRTTYAVAHGAGMRCGSTWQAPPVGVEVVSGWIERLRG